MLHINQMWGKQFTSLVYILWAICPLWVHGIFQARTLECVAISFSNAWKWKVKVKLLSHVRLLATPWTAAHWAPLSVGFSRQEYWSGVPLPSPHKGLRPAKSFTLVHGPERRALFPDGSKSYWSKTGCSNQLMMLALVTGSLSIT